MMTWRFRACFVAVSVAGCLWGAVDPELRKQVEPLSPEAALATFEVPEGYRLEVVASEPMVREPVVCAWDGNGAMYVAQMDTYMQDADATNEHAATSKVVRLVDTDGDGKMDKSTVFVDGLVLPRMILPLDERIVIGTTHTRNMYAYTDTDGDGVADKKELWWQGGGQGGNMEHQPSGLIWNVDNWIYTTYTKIRLRFTSGTVVAEPVGGGPSQWGMAHDDRGRIYTGSAGGERSFQNFQQPWAYGLYSLPGELEPGFDVVWPIDNIPDVQGGPGRIRPDNTLNHFTAGCGHSVYRDSLMPGLTDNLFICEPVGRLIRRTTVSEDGGGRILRNPHQNSEFIRTRDPNFRPVNTALGPDGCLYIVDMYRGIIQEGNWTKRGSYLRGVIDRYGLAENIGRGRIYRLMPTDGAPRAERPKMLDETPAQLLAHLDHPNGWWRDTARKLIILRGDKSVVDPLAKMVADKNLSPLGRVAALWTLEGLDALTEEILNTAVAAGEEDVQIAGVQAARSLLQADDAAMVESIRKVVSEGGTEALKIQTFLASRDVKDAVLQKALRDAAIEGVVAETPRAWYVKSHLDAEQAQAAEAARLEKLRQADAAWAESVARGKEHYGSICAACHGVDGNGVKMAGTDLKLGAPLVGSPRVIGNEEGLIRLVLAGLTGHVDGKIYPGLMQPMASQSDEWLADVLTYVRNEWDNDAPRVTSDSVASVRAASADRKTPWTLEELRPWLTNFAKDASTWTVTASHNDAAARMAVDGNLGSRWDSARIQAADIWFQIAIPAPIDIAGLRLDTAGSANDYARSARIEASADGTEWTTVIENHRGSAAVEDVLFDKPVRAKFVKITLTGGIPRWYWSIHELGLLTPEDVAAAAKERAEREEARIRARQAAEFSVLLFTKTAKFRHASIPDGVRAVETLADKHGFYVEHTEDSSLFTLENLKRFQAVIFLSTTGDVLNPEQQTAFEKYVQAGGGFVGVHSATDTEYKWPWFEKMIGAYFNGHPKVQPADLVRTPHKHQSVDFLPERWRRTDEWYNFRNISSEITVLLNLDETTYRGGTNGERHPAAWHQEYDGGRMFYTAGGHTSESFKEPLFLRHLLEGIRYAAGQPAANPTADE